MNANSTCVFQVFHFAKNLGKIVFLLYQAYDTKKTKSGIQLHLTWLEADPNANDDTRNLEKTWFHMYIKQSPIKFSFWIFAV